jgi:hypothetical protein
MNAVDLPASNHFTCTFPFASIPGRIDGLPIEVCLVAQLTPGSGNKMFYSVLARQREHSEFVDELEEPSAKLHSTNFAKGDSTAVYSFGVGSAGHPFHRHAGHRVFTAVAGSGGAQLRFSTASPAEIAEDPNSFVRALRIINIPADCVFTVRFGGETWHQFMPLQPNTKHPTFFALSCHTNELGGNLSEEIRQKVLIDSADIPSLTELLPESVLILLEEKSLRSKQIPTTSLFLDHRPKGFMDQVCKTARSLLGSLCGTWEKMKKLSGFVQEENQIPSVFEHPKLPDDSLLKAQLSDRNVHHVDHFTLTLSSKFMNCQKLSASLLLADFLGGFLNNPPAGVTRLMKLRNAMVRPLKLRTSPLGCPVSSLLSEKKDDVFAGQYPVLSQLTNKEDSCSQVILGANDKHLVFRSCVSVTINSNDAIVFSLSTKVACKNMFGRFYMAIISQTHRKYITPTMLMYAVSYIVKKQATDQTRGITKNSSQSNPFGDEQVTA